MSDPSGRGSSQGRRDRDGRRRLLAASVAAPGAAPGSVGPRWSALLVGLVTTALLVVGTGVASRVLRPAAVSVQEGDLVVSGTSGARYLALDGALHPVLNISSARLLAPGGAVRTVVVGDDVLLSRPRGPVLGIPGAPDDLPPPGRLLGAGWVACPLGAGVVLRPDDDRAVAATASTGPGPQASTAPGEAVTVLPARSTAAVAAAPYLLVAGRRLPEPTHSAGALRTYLEQPAAPVVVPDRLLDLFAPGTPLDASSLRLADLGAPLAAALRRPTLDRVGQLVQAPGSVGLVLADGFLPLGPFAAAVYAATAPSGLGRSVVLDQADLATLPTSATTDPTPADWPRTLPTPGTGLPCARLTASASTPSSGPTTSLLFTPAPTSPTAPTTPGAAATPAATPRSDGTVPALVPPGAGALLRVPADAADASPDGDVLLVDGTGTAYPLAEPVSDTLARLGYGAASVASLPTLPPAWAALLPRGPALGTAAARRGPG